MWSFVYTKRKNKKDDNPETGDVWNWVAIDQDTKLVISFYTGLRDLNAAKVFLNDLYQRLLPQYNIKTQITTDGYKAYQEAMADTFGGKINFAQLVKQYSKEYTDQDGKIDKREHYIGAEKRVLAGKPDLKYVTTAHIERQNLTMRMGVRRLARDTNAFSKKLDNHWYAVAIQFVYYNFCRIHKTLRVTPAMEAGLIKKPMTFEDLAQLPDKYLFPN
jgi:IS1 family transposase